MFHLDVPIPDLFADLRAVVEQIPRGRVATYGDLAAALGDRRAARWISDALSDVNRLGPCPDHRIVRTTGELAAYGRGTLAEKARLLRREGIEVADARLDLDRYRFQEFHSSAPLAALAAYQEQLHKRVELRPLEVLPDRVAGVDVSYPRPDEAVAAYALVETATGRLLWSYTLALPVAFPYITGYLTFRELPALLAVLNAAEAAGRLASVVLVDGSGLLHPRGVGIATNLGVVTGLSSIGVSKTLLSGSVDLGGLEAGEARPIVHLGQVRGAALKSQAKSRPVFVSPGSGIDVDGATRVVQALFFGHRLPEPTWQADSLSRSAGRASQPRGERS